MLCIQLFEITIIPAASCKSAASSQAKNISDESLHVAHGVHLKILYSFYHADMDAVAQQQRFVNKTKSLPRIYWQAKV